MTDVSVNTFLYVWNEKPAYM